MQQNDIYINTSKRLEKYALFSEATIKTVASLAEKQAGFKSYKDFFSEVGVPAPKFYISKSRAGVPYVDIASEFEKKGVVVVHLPMANPLDENMLYQVATIAAVLPEYRIIAFGNPSGHPYKFKQQNLTVWQKTKVAFTNKMRALVAAELEYLKSQNISNVHHVGYSYGAHKALIESFYSQQGMVQSITLIDPVAHPRGIKQLTENFSSTLQPMGGYVDRTNIPSYFEARRVTADSKHHDTALRRPINIAIGLLLKRVDFIRLLEETLTKQKAARATVAWASESELGNDAHLKVSLHRLKYVYKKNIHTMRLDNDKHALANDIHLYAAIVRDAISQ